MVSNANEDFPEPDRPVITVSRSRGISTSTFFRLCSRAPRMEMFFSIVRSVAQKPGQTRTLQPWPRGSNGPNDIARWVIRLLTQPLVDRAGRQRLCGARGIDGQDSSPEHYTN